MATNNNQKLAVLIDADNAQASVVQELLAEVSRYGTATIKRAYGDWTTQHLKSWKEVLHKLAIQPIQQFAYTTGKNSTDASLIIDAMDVLHAGGVDGFCLVSSDSDYPPGHTHPRSRAGGVRLWRAQDTRALCGGVRQVHLHRDLACQTGGAEGGRSRG